MARIWKAESSAGGVKSDECTAKLDHVLEGETAVTSDSNDEAGVGRMKVNSLLSFSVAAYSGRRVLAKWQNPNQAAGRPYSGVIIRYSTSGYPGTSGGTQIYKGAGNNTASGGQSQTYLDMPNLNTTYYFTAIPYVTTNFGELLGTPVNAQGKTNGTLLETIKGTQTYTIPAGFSKMDIFCVAGGGSGYQSYAGSGSIRRSGDGGGSGYTKTVKNISIKDGQKIDCVIGAGRNSSDGGKTSVSRVGTELCAAEGGKCSGGGVGGDGGSGGGGGTQELAGENYGAPGKGGQDGKDGLSGYMRGGKGQGKTTKAFEESSGTLYASGGCGGGCLGRSGASNGSDSGRGGDSGQPGHNGAANTGDGGGGAGTLGSPGGAGGSGVILLRLY